VVQACAYRLEVGRLPARHPGCQGRDDARGIDGPEDEFDQLAQLQHHQDVGLVGISGYRHVDQQVAGDPDCQHQCGEEWKLAKQEPEGHDHLAAKACWDREPAAAIVQRRPRWRIGILKIEVRSVRQIPIERELPTTVGADPGARGQLAAGEQGSAGRAFLVAAHEMASGGGCL